MRTRQLAAVALAGVGAVVAVWAVARSGLVSAPVPAASDASAAADGAAPADAASPFGCANELVYRLTSEYRHEGNASLDAVLAPETSYEVELTLTPVAHQADAGLFAVRAELRDTRGLPPGVQATLPEQLGREAWVRVEPGRGVVELLGRDPTYQMNALRPFLAPLVAKGNGEVVEDDPVGPVKVRYERRVAGGIDKVRLSYADALPGGGGRPKIVESRFAYELDAAGSIVRLIARERQDLPGLAGQSLRVDVTLAATRTAVRPVETAVAAACERSPSLAAFQAQHRLRPATMVLEVDRAAEAATKRRRTEGETVASLWRKVQLAASEDDAGRILDLMVDLLETQPAALSEVAARIGAKTEPDDEFTRLIAVLAAARAPDQPATIQALMERLRQAEAPLLERLIRAQQLSLNIEASSFPLLWDLSRDRSLPEGARQVALLTLGSGLGRDGVASYERAPFRERIEAQLDAADVPHGERIVLVAALGNSGDPESLPRLEALAAAPDRELALEAIESLRFVRADKARELLLGYARATRELEKHDRAIMALRYQTGDAATTAELLRIRDALPASEGDRRRAIEELVGVLEARRPEGA